MERKNTELPARTTPPTGRHCMYLALHNDGRIGAYGFGDVLSQPHVEPGSTIVQVASYDMLGRRHKVWNI